MESSYHQTPAYIWYLNDHRERRGGLPYFEIDERLQFKVAVGEIYCRVHMQNDRACHITRAFSSPGGLKQHLKVYHKLDVAPVARGGLSIADDFLATEFYIRMYKLAKGEDTPLQTPLKGDTITNETTH
jgi:hypothetical protein